MGELFTLLPYIMQAIELAPKVITALRTGTSVVTTLQTFGPDVIKLLQGVGQHWFPTLAPDHQVEAAALVTYDRDTVRFVQDALNKLGAVPLPLVVDGSYGRLTKAAVEAFQAKYKVTPADGWAGPVTQAALHAEINKLAAAAAPKKA